MLSSKSMPPTPITSIWSAGLFRVLNWGTKTKGKRNNFKWIIQIRANTPRKIKDYTRFFCDKTCAAEMDCCSSELSCERPYSLPSLYWAQIISLHLEHPFLLFLLVNFSYFGPRLTFSLTTSNLKGTPTHLLWTSQDLKLWQFITNLYILTSFLNYSSLFILPPHVDLAFLWEGIESHICICHGQESMFSTDLL